MTKDRMEAVFARVLAWPPEKQEMARDILLWIEARGEIDFALTPEQEADLAEALAEADRGEFVPEDEMKAFFAKHR